MQYLLTDRKEETMLIVLMTIILIFKLSTIQVLHLDIGLPIFSVFLMRHIYSIVLVPVLNIFCLIIIFD